MFRCLKMFLINYFLLPDVKQRTIFVPIPEYAVMVMSVFTTANIKPENIRVIIQWR